MAGGIPASYFKDRDGQRFEVLECASKFKFYDLVRDTPLRCRAKQPTRRHVSMQADIASWW